MSAIATAPVTPAPVSARRPSAAARLDVLEAQVAEQGDLVRATAGAVLEQSAVLRDLLALVRAQAPAPAPVTLPVTPAAEVAPATPAREGGRARDAKGRYLPADGVARAQAPAPAPAATPEAPAPTTDEAPAPARMGKQERAKWNDTVSAGISLAGKRADGVTFYALVLGPRVGTDTTLWDEFVTPARKAGRKAAEVLAEVLVLAQAAPVPAPKAPKA